MKGRFQAGGFSALLSHCYSQGYSVDVNEKQSNPFMGSIAMLMSLLDVCKQWFGLVARIRRERQVLSQLTDAQLLDIGIHRSDVNRECRRGVLDIPANRIVP